jgi:hypothetical protein
MWVRDGRGHARGETRFAAVPHWLTGALWSRIVSGNAGWRISSGTQVEMCKSGVNISEPCACNGMLSCFHAFSDQLFAPVKSTSALYKSSQRIGTVMGSRVAVACRAAILLNVLWPCMRSGYSIRGSQTLDQPRFLR